MTAEPRTIACAEGRPGEGRDHDCEGYIAPLVYGGSRPCHCSCHETAGTGNARNWSAAQERARRSFYAQPDAPAGLR